MRAHTNDFKTEIKKFGRELDSKITFTSGGSTITLGQEDLNNITPSVETSLLKSVMKSITIDSNTDIPKDTELNYKFGVKTRSGKNLFDKTTPISVMYIATNVQRTGSKTFLPAGTYTVSGGNSNIYTKTLVGSTYGEYHSIPATLTLPSDGYILLYAVQGSMFTDAVLNSLQIEQGTRATSYEAFGMYDYIDYGNFVVKSTEYSADNNAYIIKAYDKMLYSMKEYTTLQNGEFPMSLRDFINAVCIDIGLEFQNVNDNFANYDKVLKDDPFANINYTYRDVLDDIAEATASNVCINSSDKLEIRYINDTNDTIDEEYLKDINVNFGEVFGAVNTIILSRSEDSDKYTKSYPDDLPDEDKVPVIIKDNQIMNGDDRSEYVGDILTQLNGLTFYMNDFTSTGIMYYEACDKYTVTIDGTNYTCILFNDEQNITQGLVERIDTPMPDIGEQEYKYMTAEEKVDRATKLIVDKANKRITAQAQELEIIATNIDKTNGDIKSVTPVNNQDKYFTFNSNGLLISAGDNGFRSLSKEDGTYYYDGEYDPDYPDRNKIGEYTKDGSKQKDLSLFGAYKYGMDEITDTPLFVGQLYTDADGNECFGHFWNGSDI